MLTEAIENLEAQAVKLAAQPGAPCPQDFSALETGRPLRISMFYGYDDHDGKVYDRANADAMSHVLTSECRGQLSTCGFSRVSRSRSVERLTRTIGGREVEVDLFTSSLADDATETTSLPSAKPSLSLILTTGGINYGPAEQASLGALEAILSKDCGHAFHEAMISVTEPEPTMTYLFRGQ